MANRLAGETSPYLLQHAHNPVDWYPWGPDALERARREDRPIVLSIGYAACHWCHVMERESFEDAETATFMNEHFVSIKVDREERPDLDAVYMDAVQAMTGQGGWPMTVFLTPDGHPFYGGTYFPNEDRHGLPSFRRVMEAVADAWRNRRAELAQQGLKLTGAIERMASARESVDPLTEDALRDAFSGLERTFDRDWGGFGGAPKFPQPMTLEFLLRAHLRGYPGALEMFETTLDRMAAGGMYDQVGGGFHRYSVDGRWHVPHFEKMLYDNAQLARVYLHAWQVTGDDRYRRVATETLDYLLREMRHPEGGFFSSQDADSEGVEGKFFAWSYDELRELVGDAVAAYFGSIPAGNWEGTNVLWTPLPLEAVAAEEGMAEAELAGHVAEARRRLFEIRAERVHPGTDDKVLAAWNGLAILAFAEAGRALGDQRYLDAATAAAEFVLTRLRRDDRRLLRAWRDGRAGRPAYADDHALMAEACLVLSESTLDLRFLEEARALADDLLRLFRDPDGGGFFQTGTDAEQLVVRPKELFDNAMPAANSAAALVLQRLALIYGDAELERAGVSALRLVRDHLSRAPTGFGYALSALDLYLSDTREVAIVGDPGSADTRRLAAEVWSRFLPHVVLAGGKPKPAAETATETEIEIEGRAGAEIPLLAGRTMLDGRAAAYVCERFVCKWPVAEPEELAAQLTG